MPFRLKFDTDNAAFAEDPCGEIAAVLREVAKRVESYREGGYPFGSVTDTNGNTIGDWSLAGMIHRMRRGV